MARSPKQHNKPKINTFTTVIITCIITLFFVILLGYVPGIDYFRYYVSGYSINRSAMNAPARTVLWEQPKLLLGQMNEVHGNNNGAISPDGQKIILTRSYSSHNKDLYISKLIDEKWSKPRPLNSINSQYNEITPEITPDGKYLLFASNRPGGHGGYDIWCTQLSEYGYSEPFVLDININSKYNEKNPYISKDMASLFLSSDRPLGLLNIEQEKSERNYDIFESIFNTSLKPKAYKNIDYFSLFKKPNRQTALNSPYDEGKVAITNKGNLIYFSSNRPGGVGGYDLYKSFIIEGQYIKPYNFGEPINTIDDEISPSLTFEGFGLYFCSNYNSRNPSNFYMYNTTSREVITKYDYSIFTKILLVIIFILLILFVIWVILKLLLYKSNMRMIIKCLLIALLLHLLFAYMSAFWFFSDKLSRDQLKTPEEMTVNINNLARESIASAIREGTASLPKVKSASSAEKQVEKVTIPAQKPSSQANASVSWQASLIKVNDNPVKMSKSKSESNVKSATVVDNSINSVRPMLSGATSLTLESPEGLGENEAAPQKGQAKGLPNATNKPSFKQKKKRFKKNNFKRKQPIIELEDIDTVNINDPIIKTPMNKSHSNSALLGPSKSKGKDINKAGKTQHSDVVHSGANAANAGWNKKSGSLVIENSFLMIIPNKSSGYSDSSLGLLKNDKKRLLEHLSISYSGDKTQTEEVIIQQIYNDLIKRYYPFTNFTIVEVSDKSKFIERVDRILYSATPKFIIITDSELEVPEEYLNEK